MENHHLKAGITKYYIDSSNYNVQKKDMSGGEHIREGDSDPGPAYRRRGFHLGWRGASPAAVLIAVLAMLGLALGPGNAAEPEPGASSPHIRTTRLTAAYHRDFRSGDFDFRSLRLEGPPGVADLAEMGREGLRLTVPPGLGKPVGVTTRFHIRGDFEITASFEVPPGIRPQSNSRVKAELYIRPEGEWGNYASMALNLQPEGMLHSFGRGDNDTGQRRHTGRWAPAKARSGAFRLVRTGSTLHYLLAEGDDDNFREVFQTELWSGDVERARVTAIAEGPQTQAQVIWKDLTIRAEALPGLAGGSPGLTGSPWLLLTGGLVVVLLCGGMVWVGKRRSRRVSPGSSIGK